LKGLTRRQSNQSRKADIVNYLPVADLKAQWKKKGKEELQCSVCSNLYISRYPVRMETVLNGIVASSLLIAPL
jgi:hypothetical protein